MAFKDAIKKKNFKGKPGKKGGGFQQAVKNVKKGGKYTEEEASAIVANASRKASPFAKRNNPNLKKVKG